MSIFNIDDYITIELNADSKDFYTQLCNKLICNANALTSYCNENDCSSEHIENIQACLTRAILILTLMVIDGEA